MSFWKRIFGIKQPEKKETKNIPTKEQFIEESDDFLPREDKENNTEPNIIIMTDLKSFFEKYSQNNKEFCERIEQRGREDAKNIGKLYEHKEIGLKPFLEQVRSDFEKLKYSYLDEIRKLKKEKIKHDSLSHVNEVKIVEEDIKNHEDELKDIEAHKEAFNKEEGFIYNFVKSVYERGFHNKTKREE